MTIRARKRIENRRHSHLDGLGHSRALLTDNVPDAKVALTCSALRFWRSSLGLRDHHARMEKRMRLGDAINWSVATAALVMSAVLLVRSHQERGDTRRWRAAQSAQVEGKVLAHVVTTSGRDSVPLGQDASRGRSVLYVFRTDCPVCEHQREEFASLAATLTSTQIITASPEPDANLNDYWAGTALDGHPVRRLSREAMEAVGARVVPTILVLDHEARAIRLLPGRLDSESARTLKRLMSVK